MKSKRKPAGYRETDRHCALCHTEIPKDKYLNRHHLCYEPTEIQVSLHYNCHNVTHGRVKYHCPYDKKYGVDFAPVFRAKAILEMYKQVMSVIQKKFPEEAL